MRGRSIHLFLRFALLLLVGLVAQGQEYKRPKPDADGGPPTTADLAIHNGASKSVTVQLLNITPYDIQFVRDPGVTWSITSANEADMQDHYGVLNQKSFMFVPVGVPSLIPGAPAQDFLNPGDPGYDENYQDTTTHPYSMVFSWDDRGGFVVDNWVKWTVKGVKYCPMVNHTCVEQSQDVDLGLWMYRIKPTFNLSSGLLPVISQSLQTAFKLLTLPVKAENPLAWANTFLALTELAKDVKEFAKENTQENDGEKMWVASYVIPNPTSNCVAAQSQGMECEPAPLTADDAVYSKWDSIIGGPCSETTCAEDAAEAELVVSVHVLRGQKAKQCDPLFYPHNCPLGAEPVVMITVMLPEDFVIGAVAGIGSNLSAAETPENKIRLFLLQAGAGRIRQLLKEQGRRGLLELRSLIVGLDPAQRHLLKRMIRTMGSGQPPTQEERRLVHLLATELQARLK